MRIPVAGLLLPAAFALALTTGVDARDRLADSPHLRPATPAASSFVSGAAAASPIVRGLLEKLEQGNVVAYVHLVPATPGLAPSTLTFVGRSSSQRFVLLHIGNDVPADRQIALLGHELQHVLELTRAPWVTSQADVQSLLAMIGWRDATRASGFETGAAVAVEHKIAKQLRAVSRPLP